ncbi:MAG: hypothetical protein ISR55_05410 [Bacteroidetes bacterium]|nr:hypothetical protein [Bacteroidota bacterium]
MKNIILISFLIALSNFSFGQSNIIPIESKSGLYEISQGKEIIKVETLRYHLLFKENKQEDIALNNYSISITIGNNKACKLTLIESQDSIHIKCKYIYIDQSEMSIPKSSFEKISFRNYEYSELSANSFTRINFYETIPLYLIIDYPLHYQDKTYIIHLKPDFL